MPLKPAQPLLPLPVQQSQCLPQQFQRHLLILLEPLLAALPCLQHLEQTTPQQLAVVGVFGPAGLAALGGFAGVECPRLQQQVWVAARYFVGRGEGVEQVKQL